MSADTLDPEAQNKPSPHSYDVKKPRKSIQGGMLSKAGRDDVKVSVNRDFLI